MNELVVYTPNPSAVNELWEITAPLDVRIAPPLSDTNGWRQELNNLRTSPSAQRIVLTDLLRVGAHTDGSNTTRRAALRFETVRRPSAAQWQSFLDGNLAWDALPWVQGVYGRNVGLAQSRCRMEIQLRPGESTDNHRDSAIPFFGSGAVYFNLTRP
jgi:hypothetical protein